MSLHGYTCHLKHAQKFHSFFSHFLINYSLIVTMVTFITSKLPYEVSNDQALAHEEVKKRISQTIQVLIDATEKFQTTILASVGRIP